MDKKDFGQKKINLYKYFVIAQEKLNLNNDLNFLKTHSCCGTIGEDKFTNKENTHGFVYLIRDPRSVAISYAYHSNQSYENSVNEILNEKSVAYDEDNIITYRSSWKVNYFSWIKSPYPRVVLKYEELKKDEFNNFKKVLEFINKFKKIEIDVLKIKKTIEKWNFQKLKYEEIKICFIERWGKENFFREGKIDEWENKLSKDLIKKIEKAFEEIMINYDYL